MIRQHKTSESITAIAGGALVGLGLHILSGSHDTAADQFLGNTAGDALARSAALRRPGVLASCASLCLGSSWFLAVLPPDVAIILAAASRRRRNGSVVGCFRGSR